MVSLADRYRRPADLPPRIPLFPLRGAILLPGSTLPLNIFEPRYLEMIEDVMSGSRMLGMIQPVGSDAQESPPEREVDLRRIGGAGRITSYQELDDGRFAIARHRHLAFRNRGRGGDRQILSRGHCQLRSLRHRSYARLSAKNGLIACA